MAIRCTADEVAKVINTDPSVDLQSFINTATALTDQVETNDTASVLSEALLKQIEIYLSAHYYSLYDPQPNSKRIGRAGESYKERDWWEEAEKLDLTGYLQGLSDDRIAPQLVWLGKEPSARIPYHQRD